MTGPTPTEVMAHINAGGDIERRSTPAGPWLSSADHPTIMQRLWSRMPDEPLTTYRLVPLDTDAVLARALHPAGSGR